MKLFTVLLALMLVALFQNNAFSQEIPNAGFENWTNGEPDGWYSDNISGSVTPVTQSSQSHSGSSAVKINLALNFGYYWPGFIRTGSLFYEGFPVSQAYGSLTGYYQFNKISTAAVYIIVYMHKNGTSIGGGAIEIDNGTSGYSQFVVPIYQSDVPDTASIWIGVVDSSGGHSATNSYVLIDDLAFGGAVGVNDKVPAAATFQLKQNYPNPFNPATTIEFSVPEKSSVNLKVYNILGVEVASLASGTYSPGNHKVIFNGENLASGIYLTKIIATSKESNRAFSKIIKMTLLK